MSRFAHHQALGMPQQRVMTPWRLWHKICSEVKSTIMMLFPPRPQGCDDCLKSMMERSRKRRLQILPDSIYQLIEEYGI
jgi:hypothetical protein